MTFEEMKEILANLATSQANHNAQMTDFQIQLQTSQANHEAQMAEIRLNIAKTELNIAKTEAIANSNARAIEAAANEGAENRRLAQNTQRQLTELVQVVSQFVAATNSRLSGLENR